MRAAGAEYIPTKRETRLEQVGWREPMEREEPDWGLLGKQVAEYRARKQQEYEFDYSKQGLPEEEARRREEQRALEAQEAEKKRQAEEAARRAAEEKARKDKEAQAYRDLMNPSGKGSGSGTKSGTQGSPEGQAQQGTVGSGPGTGKVGAGLSNRGIRNAPKINDRSQKTGRVVIEVCVDRNGRVVKADYTQRGSTTNDAELIELSKRNAMNFTFSPSDVDEQCGTISYDFKVR